MLKYSPQPWSMGFSFEVEQITDAMAKLAEPDNGAFTCFIARSMTNGEKSGNMSQLLGAKDTLEITEVQDITCFGPQPGSLAATGWFSPETPGAYYIFRDHAFVAPYHDGAAIADPMHVPLANPSCHASLAHLIFYGRLLAAHGHHI